MSTFKDYYQVLELHYTASQEAVKASYRRLSHLHHPDSGGHVNYFLRLQEAYDTLKDKEKRKSYDQLLRMTYLPASPFSTHIEGKLYQGYIEVVQNQLHQYFDAIKDKDYKRAYKYLSDIDKKHVFKKDFITWQCIISEVHHLLGYETVVETVNTEPISVYFKVKVKEYNRLLNRVEEDYFTREVVYEDMQWKVKLTHHNVKPTIKKYKRILATNKKSKSLNKYLSKTDENHTTKLISKKYLVNNANYELLRFKRYSRPFSLIYLSGDHLNEEFEKLLRINTRDLDSLCKFSKTSYLLLLPETDFIGSRQVEKKLKSIKEGISVSCVTSNEHLQSIKEMINSLL